MPEEKLIKEAVELVTVEKDSLKQAEVNLKKQRQEREQQQKQVFAEDKSSIYESTSRTEKDLGVRMRSMFKMIERKQERSQQEFSMKAEVLNNNFHNSVDSLIKNIKKSRQIITSSYGPVVLNSKRHDKPIFSINPVLDPKGHKWVQHLNKTQD